MSTLKGKDLISIHDLSSEEISEILGLTKKFKDMLKRWEAHKVLQGKVLAMIFEKPSTRTRVSFEVGAIDLGAQAITLNPNEIQLGVRETVGDVAKTLSRYVDGIVIRTFSHSKVVELAKYASVPVINALSDLSHPCQGLSDICTIEEKKGLSKDLKVTYIGDGNNVCHSLMFACAKVGINLTIATPQGFEPKEEVVKLAFADAKKTGIEIDIMNDPVAAASGADVIYTDVWASMGQESEKQSRSAKFRKFQVNKELMKLAKPDCIFMHCLPAHRGEEVTDEVLDGPNSVVFDQAENRLHVQKAIMALLIGG